MTGSGKTIGVVGTLDSKGVELKLRGEQLMKLDCNINDPPFALRCCELIESRMER